MDETKTRWFRWIAANAQYLFWIVWGAGAGAFLVTFTKGVDTDGSMSRFYLAVLSATMGGVLGLIGSRGMDRLADTRSIRRKANVVTLRVRRLRRALDSLLPLTSHTFLRQMHEGSADAPVGFVFGAYQLVEMASKESPNLDDLIDTEGDLEMMDEATRAFEFASYRFVVPVKITTDDPEAARKYFYEILSVPGTTQAVTKARDALLTAERYLAERRAP